jgi:hypothetical protein
MQLDKLEFEAQSPPLWGGWPERSERSGEVRICCEISVLIAYGNAILFCKIANLIRPLWGHLPQRGRHWHAKQQFIVLFTKSIRAVDHWIKQHGFFV